MEPVPSIDTNSRSSKRSKPIEGTGDDVNWSEWVSASKTRNYLIRDPLLDWLDYHSKTLAAKLPKMATAINSATTVRNANNFTEFIMAQGNEFEAKVMEHLYSEHKDVIVDIGGNGEASRSLSKYQDTINAMNRGVPIIYSGVLRNPNNKTYGVPDLMVRSDWLGDIVRTTYLEEHEEEISAPNLTDIFDNPDRPGGARPPRYHYVIVDIKFTTLNLRADGIHLLNAGSIPAYKGQMWIYTQALGYMQGYTPRYAYILGRRWKYQSRGVTYKGESCTDRLGVINFDTVDLEYAERTQKAIDWIKDMRANGKSWDLIIRDPEITLARPELFPNMSNTHDYPWHNVKKELAEQNKEITQLWMCGVKNRLLAHAQGVYKWTDPQCTTFILGIHGEKTSKVLNAIMDINRNHKLHKILPKIIQNNEQNWQRQQRLEMFVDFEFVNDVVSDFSQMPRVDAKAIIFMIGVGYYDMENNWIYREFTVDDLTQQEECRICTEFSNYVVQEAEWYECPNPLLVHWSNAENWQWESAFDKHGGIQKAWIPSKKNGDDETEPRWFDLLQVFRSEPVVIKGCLGFGLKEVAGVMADLGFIKTRWEVSSSCVDGTGAMLGAFKSAKDARARRLKLKDMPLVREIAKYNEVDCKVVGEIMQYIRANHTDLDNIDNDDIEIFH